MVWLNPIYSSPNDDNEYDVSDYRNIMKDFGTMADFDTLLKGMHERGIKLVKVPQETTPGRVSNILTRTFSRRSPTVILAVQFNFSPVFKYKLK